MLCVAALAPSLPLIAFFKVLVSMGFFEDGYQRATLLSHARLDMPQLLAHTNMPHSACTKLSCMHDVPHSACTDYYCRAAHCRAQRRNNRLLPLCPEQYQAAYLPPSINHAPSFQYHALPSSQPRIWSPGAEMDKVVVAKAKEQFSALDKVSSSSS